MLHLERIGIDDNFFNLGGHSLSAARLASRIRATFNIELPLRTFFEAPTVAELVRKLPQLNCERLMAPTQVQDLLASDVQDHLWFLDSIDELHST